MERPEYNPPEFPCIPATARMPYRIGARLLLNLGRGRVQEFSMSDNPENWAELQALIHRSSHASPDVRESVLLEAVRLFPPLGMLLARAGLSDPNPHVRDVALDCLAEPTVHLDTYRVIRSAKYDPDWGVRCTAAQALGSLGGPKARRALMSCLKTERHPCVRRDLALALADAGAGAEVLDILAEMAACEPTDLSRAGMLIALYRGGLTSAGDQLLAFFAGPDWLVQENILHGLPPEQIATSDRDRWRTAVQHLMENTDRPGLLVPGRDWLNELGAL